MKKKAVFPARFDQVFLICRFVAQGAQAAGLNGDDIFRVELACDEACTNIIEHAYGGENLGEIDVEVQADNGCLRIELHDTGRPFKPDQVSAPERPIVVNNDEDLERLQAGGLGLHFMRTVMDEVRFEFNAAGGNTLTMIKYG